MNISTEQKEKIIADLVKCVDGLHMADAEVLFDLARNKAFESAKVTAETQTPTFFEGVLHGVVKGFSDYEVPLDKQNTAKAPVEIEYELNAGGRSFSNVQVKDIAPALKKAEFDYPIRIKITNASV